MLRPGMRLSAVVSNGEHLAEGQCPVRQESVVSGGAVSLGEFHCRLAARGAQYLQHYVCRIHRHDSDHWRCTAGSLLFRQVQGPGLNAVLLYFYYPDDVSRHCQHGSHFQADLVAGPLQQFLVGHPSRRGRRAGVHHLRAAQFHRRRAAGPL